MYEDHGVEKLLNSLLNILGVTHNCVLFGSIPDYEGKNPVI
jgi:hypothetical protein